MKKRTKWILFIVLAVLIVLYVSCKLINLDYTDKIAIIKIDSAIGTNGYFEKGLSSDTIIGYINDAKNDNTIKGIIFEINSPGGEVVASEEIANAVKSIEKPKVAFIRDLGASGAYWIASATDVIIADPMSITGSIGVIGSYLDFSGLIENYNITYHSLTAGKYKDAGSPWKELNPDEEKMIQTLINDIQDFFINEVAQNRNIDKQKLKNLEARIFLGKEAKELGLVDYLGNKELAINITKGLANISDAEIIIYEEQKSLLKVLSNFGLEASYNLGKGYGSNFKKRLEIKV